jgi:Kef-type K+ transport system membrane component KefB
MRTVWTLSARPIAKELIESIEPVFHFLVPVFFVVTGIGFDALIGKLFDDIAVATVGRTRGGSAKVSIIASCLFGTNIWDAGFHYWRKGKWRRYIH